jgi:hypothetical protein
MTTRTTPGLNSIIAGMSPGAEPDLLVAHRAQPDPSDRARVQGGRIVTEWAWIERNDLDAPATGINGRQRLEVLHAAWRTGI